MKNIETPSGKNERTENFPVEKLIRADLRPHVTAFYIFARAADDISDNPLLDAEDKISRLDSFGAALLDKKDDSVAGVLPLRKSLEEKGLTPQHALDLLHAFKQDAVKTRYHSWDELLHYCRYSANPVGRHVLALHGLGKEVWEWNDALCTSLQILNHLQDCADDYRELDRVYIPLDIFTAYGSNETELANEKSSPALRRTFNAVLDRTQPLIVKGQDLPEHISDRHLRIDTAVIGVVAASLESVLRKKDPLCDNVKLSKLQKFRALLLGTLRGFL